MPLVTAIYFQGLETCMTSIDPKKEKQNVTWKL